jgi:hypothetical protein
MSRKKPKVYEKNLELKRRRKNLLRTPTTIVHNKMLKIKESIYVKLKNKGKAFKYHVMFSKLLKQKNVCREGFLFLPCNN